MHPTVFGAFTMAIRQCRKRIQLFCINACRVKFDFDQTFSCHVCLTGLHDKSSGWHAYCEG